MELLITSLLKSWKEVTQPNVTTGQWESLCLSCWAESLPLVGKTITKYWIMFYMAPMILQDLSGRIYQLKLKILYLTSFKDKPIWDSLQKRLSIILGFKAKREKMMLKLLLIQMFLSIWEIILKQLILRELLLLWLLQESLKIKLGR